MATTTIGAAAKINTVSPTIAGITVASTSSAGATLDPMTGASTYFTRISGGTSGTAYSWCNATNNTLVTYTGTTYQFNVNGIYAPNYQPTFEQAFANVMTSYGLADDLSGGGNPLYE